MYIFIYFSEECPSVHQHMTKHEAPWELICSKWFICLFCDILPIETVFRVWDCLLYNGSKIILRSAVTTILLHKDEILKTKEFTELVMLFKNVTISQHTLYCHDFIEVSGRGGKLKYLNVLFSRND
jgi:hypothetical protein